MVHSPVPGVALCLETAALKDLESTDVYKKNFRKNNLQKDSTLNILMTEIVCVWETKSTNEFVAWKFISMLQMRPCKRQYSKQTY